MKTRFFKKAAGFLAAVMVSTALCTTAAFAIPGDLNNSGNANSSDARLLLRYAAKLETGWSEQQILRADLNADGKVNSSDARMLLRAAAKLEDLNTYKNYYVEIIEDGKDAVAVGFDNGNIYMESDMMGVMMGILLKKDGTIVFIDKANKRYGEMTAEELRSLSKITGSDLDFSEITNTANDTANLLPTPAALIDKGYAKGEGEWEGKTVSTYTADNQATKVVYYYDGMILLGMDYTKGGKTSTTVFANFTSSPTAKINQYLSYTQEDIMVILFDLMG